jgi:hypothetical protein
MIEILGRFAKSVLLFLIVALLAEGLRMAGFIDVLMCTAIEALGFLMTTIIMVASGRRQ